MEIKYTIITEAAAKSMKSRYFNGEPYKTGDLIAFGIYVTSENLPYLLNNKAIPDNYDFNLRVFHFVKSMWEIK